MSCGDDDALVRCLELVDGDPQRVLHGGQRQRPHCESFSPPAARRKHGHAQPFSSRWTRADGVPELVARLVATAPAQRRIPADARGTHNPLTCDYGL